jgi:hypothetical protein
MLYLHSYCRGLLCDSHVQAHEGEDADSLVGQYDKLGFFRK